MLAKKLAESGGRFDETTDKLLIKLDAVTFSRIQDADVVRLRVCCRGAWSSVDFLLKNAGKRGAGDDERMTLDIEMEKEAFTGIMNPRLKVIFQCENVLAPFVSIAMGRGALFSPRTPLTEPLN